MNDIPFEFICEDCKIPVTRWGRFMPDGTEPKRCLVCYWIYCNPDFTEEEKQKIRSLDDNDYSGSIQ